MAMILTESGFVTQPENKPESMFKVGDLIRPTLNNQFDGMSTDEIWEVVEVNGYDRMNGYIYTIKPNNDAAKAYRSENSTDGEAEGFAEIAGFENSPEEQAWTLVESKSIKDGVIHEDTTDRPVEFKAGYHEWNVLLNGEIIYSFGDFGETLEGCTDKDTLGYEVEGCIQVMLDELNESGKNIQLTNGEFDALKNQMVAKLGYHYLDLNESKSIKEDAFDYDENSDKDQLIWDHLSMKFADICKEILGIDSEVVPEQEWITLINTLVRINKMTNSGEYAES